MGNTCSNSNRTTKSPLYHTTIHFEKYNSVGKLVTLKISFLFLIDCFFFFFDKFGDCDNLKAHLCVIGEKKEQRMLCYVA